MATVRIRNLENIDIGKAVQKATLLVQSQAKALAPVRFGELRASILTDTKQTEPGLYEGVVYTNLRYAPYVEFGTGPKGQADHEGISPNVTVAYRQTPWWVHESQVAPDTGEYYHWFHIDTPEGRFYKISGQAAQPFMYPALKNNEKAVVDLIAKELRGEIENA